MNEYHLTHQIIDAAKKVHARLGPGALKEAYEACLAHELKKRGLRVECRKELPVIYDSLVIDCGYRIDLLVGNVMVVELMTADEVLPIHHAQLLSHLRLSGKQAGILINFHVADLRDGIVRKINDSYPYALAAG